MFIDPFNHDISAAWYISQATNLHSIYALSVFEEYDADVLVHPVIGPTKDDDISAYVRKQTYDALAKQLDHVQFEYLPYNMMVRSRLQVSLARVSAVYCSLCIRRGCCEK